MKSTNPADSVMGKVEVLSAKMILMAGLTIILLTFQFGGTLSAQDLLILKTGKELKVIIVEENADLIKYREFEDPKGPLYSITRDKISSVKYGKGTKERLEGNVKDQVISVPVDSVAGSTNPLLTHKGRVISMDGKKQSVTDIRTLMEDYPDALSAYETGRKMYMRTNYCAYGVILTSLVSTVIANGMEEESDAQQVRYVALAIDGGFIITAIVLASKGKQNIKSSVNIYNSSVQKTTPFSLNLGLQQNGIGLALKF